MWLPLKLNGETRWLEFARIRQEYFENHNHHDEFKGCWCSLGFHDSDDQVFEGTYESIDRHLALKLKLLSQVEGIRYSDGKNENKNN